MKRIFVYSKEKGCLVEVTKAPRQRNVAGQWPLHSEAMAIDNCDIPYAQGVLAEHGVRTEYDHEGRPILRDRAHRKAHMEALGFYDRNGGYGDASPKYYSSEYERR